MAWRAGTVTALAAALATAAAAQFPTHAPGHGSQVSNVSPMGSATGSGLPANSNVLLVDLDNDGGPLEIVVGTQTGRLYVFDHHGTIRPGWGPNGKQLPTEIGSSPAAGQLDGDTPLEIVVGCGTAVPGHTFGQLTAFEADGTVKWVFAPGDRFPPDGLPDSVYSTPALGDLGGNPAVDDVAFATLGGWIYVVNGETGQLLPGWPYDVMESIWSSPALADLNGDGQLEVIIGSDVQWDEVPNAQPPGGGIWVFRRNGSYFPGFPRFVSYTPQTPYVGIQSSPVVGDITGDGCPEIAVGTGQPVSDTTNIGRLLHVYQRDGSIPPGWPQPLTGHVVGSPALANLDGDAALEIIAPVVKFVPVGGNVTPQEGWVYAFNGNGTAVFSPIRPKTFTGVNSVTIGELAVAQVGTNNPVILTGWVGFDVTLISKTGVQLSDDGTHGAGMLTYTTMKGVKGPAAADLDDTNGAQLVIVGASGRHVSDDDDLGIWGWNAGAVGSLPWPQFRQNARRAGAAPGVTPPSCAVPPVPQDYFTVTPCRVSDSRLPFFNKTYALPKYVAGEQRTITFHANSFNPCTSIPATAKAVAINVTVDQPTHSGFLRLYPGGDGLPPTSTISFTAGKARANNSVMPLSFDGRGNLTVAVDMPPGGQVDVILDVFGYFQ